MCIRRFLMNLHKTLPSQIVESLDISISIFTIEKSEQSFDHHIKLLVISPNFKIDIYLILVLFFLLVFFLLIGNLSGNIFTIFRILKEFLPFLNNEAVHLGIMLLAITFGLFLILIDHGGIEILTFFSFPIFICSVDSLKHFNWKLILNKWDCSFSN